MNRGRTGATTGVVLALISSLTVACADPGATTGPSQSRNVATASLSSASTRTVNMMDACDGPSFNAAVGDGTCANAHGVPFAHFIAQLTANQSAGAWHNAPSMMTAKGGETLVAVNKGGEVHTFTRVAAFGGGVVPLLNALAGTPDVAPECLAETTFVPPGGTDTEVLDQSGTMLYECCIHPWMRTTVHVHTS